MPALTVAPPVLSTTVGLSRCIHIQANNISRKRKRTVRVPLMRIKQSLNWSANSSPFITPEIYYPFQNIHPLHFIPVFRLKLYSTFTPRATHPAHRILRDLITPVRTSLRVQVTKILVSSPLNTIMFSSLRVREQVRSRVRKF